jgi:hypothetical protein
MKHYILYSLFTLLTTMVLLQSCNYQTNKSNLKSDTLLTKTITFPHELYELDKNQFLKIDSFKNDSKNKAKIISIVDGNCMKCIINQLNKVDDLFNSIMNKEAMLVFVLNVSKEDSAFFMRHIRPAIETTGVILWDNNYHFERQNQLFTKNLNLRTFMINKQNKIIQYGNPIMNPYIIKAYKEKLNKTH